MEKFTKTRKEKQIPKGKGNNIFVSLFNDIFNISHVNAFAKMTIDDDKLFLTFKRQKD